MTFEVIYKDHIGEYRSHATINGETISITLRDMEFIGRGFDDLSPKSEKDLAVAQRCFPLHIIKDLGNDYYTLDKCFFELDVPFQVNVCGAVKPGVLNCIVKINSSDRLDQCPIKNVQFQIGPHNVKFEQTADFESLMNRINKDLPKGYEIKCCMSCRLSCFSRYGNDWFGSLICLRRMETNDEYLEVAYHGLDNTTEEQMQKLESTQEIFLCEEYQPMQIQDTHYKDWIQK